MDEYLPKPVRTRRLFETIDRVVDGPGVSSPSSGAANASPRLANPSVPGGKAAAPTTPSSGSNAAYDSGSIAAINVADMPAGKAVDWRVALHTVSGDRELLRSVIEMFLVESPRLMCDLREAVGRSDPGGMIQQAHTLKTSLSYLGVRNGFDLALQLEKMGRQADLNGVEAPLTALDRQLSQVMSELNEYMQVAQAAGAPEPTSNTTAL